MVWMNVRSARQLLFLVSMPRVTPSSKKPSLQNSSDWSEHLTKPSLVAMEIAMLSFCERFLSGQAGAPRDIVLFNAGIALRCAGSASSIEEGIAQAAESIDSGKALAALDGLIRASQDAPPLEVA